MGLTRTQLWRALGIDVEVARPMIVEAYEREAAREWRGEDRSKDSPHGNPWSTSFHASSFPGTNPVACGRAALYTMMDLPSEAPREPFLSAWFEVGTALEHNWVRHLHDCGRLLSKSPAVGDRYQTVFTDPEHWLSGAADAIVLPPGWTRPHNVEIKTTCLTGETLVAVADGRNAVSIRQLAVEGKDVDVYASDNGHTVICRMRNPRLTRTQAPIVRVTLDDGSFVRCTPDHRFLLLDGTYCRADELRPGTSLMRFDSGLAKPGNDRNLRRRVWMGPRGPLRYGNGGGGWRWQYRWIGERIFDEYDYYRAGGHVVDHMNGDALDDRVENLALLTRGEHGLKHWGTNQARQERSRAFAQYWASLTPEERSEHARRSVNARDQEAANEAMRQAYAERGSEWLSARSRKAAETRRRNALHTKPQNHMVLAITRDGVEDTFCGTVDETGNFAIITSGGDEPVYGELSGIVVSNSAEKVLAMQANPDDTPHSHEKYLRQLKTYIALAYEQNFAPEVVVCEESWAITREFPMGMRFCPIHQSFDCATKALQLTPPVDGTLIYSSRERPLDAVSYFVEYDPEEMAAGRRKLAEWRVYFERGLLPPHPHEGQRAKWSVDPCRYCVSPESLILRADLSWSRADEIRVGDEVVGFDEDVGNRKRSRYRRAVVTDSTVIDRPRVRVETEIGNTVVSAEHRFLVMRFPSRAEARARDGDSRHRSWRRMWVMASELRASDKIVNVGAPWTVARSYDMAYLAGVFDGEGCVSKGGHVTVAQVENVVLEAVKRILTEAGFEFSVSENGPDRRCMRVRICGGIVEQMRLLGMLRPLRLMPKAHLIWEGHATWSTVTKNAKVKNVTCLPSDTVIAIETSTHTLIADGFLGHNCGFKGGKAGGCKVDYTDKAARMADSSWVELAESIRPDYDYETARAAVFARWGVEDPLLKEAFE